MALLRSSGSSACSGVRGLAALRPRASRDSAFWPQVKINPPTLPTSGELAVEFSVTRTKWLVEKGEIGLRTLVHALATSSACAEGIGSVAVCAFAPEEQQALRAAGERVSRELADGGDGSDHELTRELLKGPERP